MCDCTSDQFHYYFLIGDLVIAFILFASRVILASNTVIGVLATVYLFVLATAFGGISLFSHLLRSSNQFFTVSANYQLLAFNILVFRKVLSPLVLNSQVNGTRRHWFPQTNVAICRGNRTTRETPSWRINTGNVTIAIIVLHTLILSISAFSFIGTA